jgi:RND family efflux transporter MFP subunit
MSKTFNFKKLLLPVVIIIITVGLMMLIFKNPPTSKRGKTSKAPQITVETVTLAPQKYQVIVQSFGTVQPRTESVLFAQVSGQINQVSKQFRDGGFFEKGDVLLELDDRDYQAEVKIAQASLMTAEQGLQEEIAKVKQAKADWERLGNGEIATDLVLRKPQLEAAKAQVLSAQALLEQDQLSLERTKILAPYAGRILNKNVDIGQVISSSTELADIFAVDYVEIRLPIKNKDLPLMKLPEEYRDTNSQLVSEDDENTMTSNVVISSDLLGKQVWQGRVIRTESAIDESSQQLYVVAQIIHPYDSEYNKNGQIKMGQYVTAEMTGKEVDNVLVIPSSAIYQGSYVYTVKEGILLRKEIKLGWQNGSESIVTEGLMAGDELVLTSLGQVSSGTPVAIAGQEPQKQKDNVRSNKPPMSDEQRKRLATKAAERGITVEALMAERQKNKPLKGQQNPSVKVIN